MKNEVKKGEQWRKGYQAGFDEALKAAGGCKSCWGKGYHTTIDYSVSCSDFTGDKSYTAQNPIMRFCDCGREKQLKDLIRQLK